MIEEMIQSALKLETDKIIEEEIGYTMTVVRGRVKEAARDIAIAVSEQFEIQRLRNEIIITVRFPNK